MAKSLTKPYRLISGTHHIPNPEYSAPSHDDPTREGYGEGSHLEVKVGDVVQLNDEQFKAFKHKFAPLGTASTDVRDADQAQLDFAKVQAVVTGQNVDPNKLGKIEPTDIDPFASARAGAVPTSQSSG